MNIFYVDQSTNSNCKAKYSVCWSPQMKSMKGSFWKTSTTNMR